MGDRERDTEESEALPESASDLLAIATDESVDPYRREAAIKRLGEVSGPAERYLEELASGDALSPIEKSLATTVLDDRLGDRTSQ